LLGLVGRFDRGRELTMRVAIVTPTFVPKMDGIVTCVCNTVEHLRRGGHEVLLAAPQGGPDEWKGARVVAAPGMAMPWYDSMRISTPSSATLRELEKFKPDVIHVLDPWPLNPLGMGALYFARSKNIPVVASYHTHFPSYLPYYRQEFLTDFLWEFLRSFYLDADLVLAPSAAMTGELAAHGIGPIARWSGGVDVELFHPGRRTNAMRERLCSGPGPVLLFVGRLAAEKDVELIRTVLERLPHVRLAIVGDGPHRSLLEKHFAGTPTRFLGALHGEELAAAFASADAFVFPSQTETQGLVVVEAMAAGCPVVAVRAGGIPEMVRDEADAFLFSPGDVEGFVACVQRALEPAEQERLRRRGPERATDWSWRVLTSKLVRVYEAVASRDAERIATLDGIAGVAERHPADLTEIRRQYERAVGQLPALLIPGDTFSLTQAKQSLGGNALATLALLAPFGALVWAASGMADPKAREDGPIEVFANRFSIASVETKARPPRSLRVLSWNIAYGRGPSTDDAGPFSRALIEENLHRIASVIAESGADVACLQEVDFDSARSHEIDQAAFLAQALGWPAVARARTWKRNYVPYPSGPVRRYFGRMDSGQCILSRFPLRDHVRHALPEAEHQPFWFRVFNLKRVLQSVVAEVEGRAIGLFNVHLEVCDRRNREAQAEAVQRLITPALSHPLVLAGDFNSVSTGAAKLNGFPDAPELDFRGEVTLRTLSRLCDALTGAEAAKPTYPAPSPNRRIDHLLVGGGVSVLGAHVIDGGPFLSDHLPIFAELQ
jgi:glycosyltransferase involved in cell wall biosynthesis/endonuclease/exonuclease/phosphatase family metal-dependent hydrolase